MYVFCNLSCNFVLWINADTEQSNWVQNNHHRWLLPPLWLSESCYCEAWQETVDYLDKIPSILGKHPRTQISLCTLATKLIGSNLLKSYNRACFCVQPHSSTVQSSRHFSQILSLQTHNTHIYRQPRRRLGTKSWLFPMPLLVSNPDMNSQAPPCERPHEAQTFINPITSHHPHTSNFDIILFN